LKREGIWFLSRALSAVDAELSNKDLVRITTGFKGWPNNFRWILRAGSELCAKGMLFKNTSPTDAKLSGHPGHA